MINTFLSYLFTALGVIKNVLNLIVVSPNGMNNNFSLYDILMYSLIILAAVKSLKTVNEGAISRRVKKRDSRSE